MAAQNEAKLIISGDPTGAKKAIDDVSKAYAEAAAKMGGSFATLSSGVGAFSTAIATLGAVLAGGALFKGSIAAANDWNSQVVKIAKAMGTTTEQASGMAVALNHLGIESDLVGKASLAMSRNLGNNEEAFTALGVQTRNLTTGAMLPAGEIMAAVNTRLAGIKNGVEQNIAGMSIYGKAWGELRGILRLTSDELKAATERAKDLGLIVGPEAAAQTRAYKEAQRDLKLAYEAMEVQIGNKLLPTMVRLGQWMAGEGRTFVSGFTAAMNVAVFAAQASSMAVQDMGDGLGAIAAQAAAILRGDLDAFRAIGEARDEQAAKNEAAYEKLKADFGKPLVAEEDVATKRKRLQTDLQTALANLEELRGVASGKVSAKIVEDDEKQTQARIKNAEKARDALRLAQQESMKDASKASAESVALLEKASGTRANAAEKAAELRAQNQDATLSQLRNVTDLAKLSDSANEGALLAKMAAQFGRTQRAAQLADQAVKDAERAQKLTDKLSDPEQKASALERVAEAQATADEARAEIKKKEAVDLEQKSIEQSASLADLNQQITDLQNNANNLKVEVDVAAAMANIQSIQAELAALQDKTVTVTVNTVQSGTPTAAPNSVSDESTFARGGYTGPGGKWQPAGIVHAGEVVINQAVVRQKGMLALLLDINRRGMAALPGFASGGLVGNINPGNLRDSPAAAQRSSAVFNFPSMGSFAVDMAADTMRALESAFAKAALQKGGRR